MAETTQTVPQKTASKTGTFFQKHKTGIIVVGAILAVGLLYLIIRGSNAGASADQNTDQGTMGFQPTQRSWGMPGTRGPAGPAGPRGPRGRRGKPGKRHKRPVSHPIHQRKSPAEMLAASTQFHTAQPGDTATSVALRHGFGDPSTVHGLNSSVIGNGPVMPGQRLRVM